MRINKYLVINMKWKDCKRLIITDLRREIGGGKISFITLLYNYMFKESFKVSVWLRLGSYFKSNNNAVSRILFYVTKVYYKHIEHKTGIQVPIGTQIGEGLKFFHHGCIIVAQSAVIGKNVSIHQGVTIGRAFAGKYAGVPVIGDSVVIFSGAKIIGNVKVGNGAVIGANAVVTKDVPENAVVAGAPAKIISDDSRKCFTEQWGKAFSHDYYE